jgi:hypothetical protein
MYCRKCSTWSWTVSRPSQGYGYGRRRSLPVSVYYPGIVLEKLRKTTKHISQPMDRYRFWQGTYPNTSLLLHCQPAWYHLTRSSSFDVKCFLQLIQFNKQPLNVTAKYFILLFLIWVSRVQILARRQTILLEFFCRFFSVTPGNCRDSTLN